MRVDHSAAGRGWFGPVGAPLELSVGEAGELFARLRATLAGTAAPALAGRIGADRAARIVFVSASDGQAPATVVIGMGAGLPAALDQASAELVAAEVDSSAWLKLDIVTAIEPGEELADGRPVGFDRSLTGVASMDRRGAAFLAEELVAFTLVDSDAVLRPRRIEDYLGRRGLPADQRRVDDAAGVARVQRFSSASFFQAGDELIGLYRGHSQARPALTADLLLAAARDAGAYLVRMLDGDGRFVYSYLPKEDSGHPSYNMVRHAGTAFAMLELYEATGDAAVLAASERAIDYLQGFIHEYGAVAKAMAVMAFRGKIKLGGVALTVLALTKHRQVTGDRRHVEVARSLCNYMVDSQAASGEFVHQRAYPKGQVLEFNSMYYPGEALFALVRMHAVDGDRRWLDVAERGARFLIEVRDADVATADLLHDHWLLYALAELHRQRPRDLYLTHALRIASAIVGAQNRAPGFADYVGTYGSPPRSTPVATRSEGLLAAYSLARANQRDAVAAEILETVRLNIGFQLQTQISRARALYLARPERSLGGFTRSLTNFEVRIDYVQHNLSSLLALRRVLTREGLNKL